MKWYDALVAEGLETDGQRRWWFANLNSGGEGKGDDHPPELTKVAAIEKSVNMGKAHAKQVSSDDKLAVRRYTSGAYHAINQYLRDNGNTEGATKVGLSEAKVQEHIASLDRATDRPVGEALTMYRGLKLTPEDYASLKPGSVMTDKGSTSTSFTRNNAEGFASAGANSVLLKVQLSPEDKGAALQSMSAKRSEYEMLLPRGQSYKVTSVTTEKSTVYGSNIKVVTVRVVK